MVPAASATAPRAALSAPSVATPAASPMYRADVLFDASVLPSLSATEPEPPDEVDALFLGAPD